MSLLICGSETDGASTEEEEKPRTPDTKAFKQTILKTYGSHGRAVAIQQTAAQKKSRKRPLLFASLTCLRKLYLLYVQRCPAFSNLRQLRHQLPVVLLLLRRAGGTGSNKLRTCRYQAMSKASYIGMTFRLISSPNCCGYCFFSQRHTPLYLLSL